MFEGVSAPARSRPVGVWIGLAVLVVASALILLTYRFGPEVVLTPFLFGLFGATAFTASIFLFRERNIVLTIGAGIVGTIFAAFLLMFDYSGTMQRSEAARIWERYHVPPLDPRFSRAERAGIALYGQTYIVCHRCGETRPNNTVNNSFNEYSVIIPSTHSDRFAARFKTGDAVQNFVFIECHWKDVGVYTPGGGFGLQHECEIEVLEMLRDSTGSSAVPKYRYKLAGGPPAPTIGRGLDGNPWGAPVTNAEIADSVQHFYPTRLGSH